MNHVRLKPEKKIDELLLLATIYSYVKQHGIPPSAEVLMRLKSDFAPSLTRIDTLRTWLYRHKGRVIRRVNDCRPYRYELSRQGQKRILFLIEPFFRKAIMIKQLGYPVKHNMRQLQLIAEDLEETVEKKLLLFDLLLEFSRA